MKRQTGCLVIGAAAWALAGSSLAQTPAKRTILQRADVAASLAQETILGTVEIAPGSGNKPHIHNGTEMATVLEGRIQLNVQGQPSRILGPGDSFMVGRRVVHQSILMGDTPAKLVSTWTIDKGGEILIPAP